ncbi:sulfate transporter [Raphidocelis subcapitata]|uniref:Sulfate transporter n=1 Tax=Raphidocelis subcapitata TaxID=307507 RepID=A0A2V0PFG1_9CHLO|nr:sulfate transporter [Raphidocelis subcapitata]|eukprot:GBF98588.1 sulfate transporter [Raphidocelis subcapitata]
MGDMPRLPYFSASPPGSDGGNSGIPTGSPRIGRPGGVSTPRSRANAAGKGGAEYWRLAFPKNDATPMPSYVEEIQDVRQMVTRQFKANQAAASKRTLFDWLAVVLPCLTWLKTYDLKKNLMWDLLAGITVGFMVVPQGMSYATLAGVPAVYGLYGAFLPVLIYSIFGSSRQLGVGPVAVTSLLIGSGIQAMVPGSEGIDNPSDPTKAQVPIQALYNNKVIQLAFLVACLYTGVGVLRFGFLIHFLSHSVITGFTSGAAIIIALSQVKYILGYSVPRADTLHESLHILIKDIHKFKWQEFTMGMCMIVWLVALRMLSKRNKKLSFIVGKIPAGLPPVTIKQWAPIPDISRMMGLAIVVMVVDLLESTSIARALARKNGYQLAYNQEIVGLGLANLAGAMFSAYTTTGSFSRSAVNNASGAKTQLAGFVTSIVVMLVLLFLTPVFAKLPYNTIAAIIIVGVTQLVEFRMAVYLFKTHLRDFVVWFTAFICTLFLGAELGLGISIGLALLIVILESAFPHTAVLGQIERTTVYRNIDQYPSADLTPGVLVVRLDAPVYFANCQWMRHKLEEYEEEAKAYAAANGGGKVEFVVLELSPVSHMDAMGAALLEELRITYKSRGIQLVLSNPGPRVLRILDRSGFTERLGREWLFVRVHDAVTYCRGQTTAALGGGGGAAPLDDSEGPRDGAGGSTKRTGHFGSRTSLVPEGSLTSA